MNDINDEFEFKNGLFYSRDFCIYPQGLYNSR
jgi:hypothetical protein